jgi:phosphatidylserine decarboxylase
MKIHKEGTATIIITILVLGGLNLLFYRFIPVAIINYVLSLAALIVFGLVLWFFRVPNRKFNIDNNKILCPADGKVVVIEETEEIEYFKDKRIQVSIFMSPLDVHRNTYPFSGKINYTAYHKGKYLVAWHPKSSTENERSTVVIEQNNGTEILVRQIAGAVARRIVPYSKENDQVEQGEELGFIKFGSRVDVFLPLGTHILVDLNEKVKSNIDFIAELKE